MAMETRNVGRSSARFCARNFQGLRGLAHRVGPYLLIEAVMPGGTLLALALYLYRARRGA
jgi:hypothetical protein